ncbi:hypothetical protein EW146_g10243 [Bondarzewia mesenterica]|uniref:Cytochrome b5 heme-binding domain-containing protein n=1 Tax=Bondarzewia mesenterica TaxID=1095465 RepID=A0A4S4KZB1_9AGAM|nr:hypothetical protein EW146_g10243 [Bondarzewia mesenterica]
MTPTATDTTSDLIDQTNIKNSIPIVAKELKEFSREDVEKHNKQGDLWVIIDVKMYDLSRFASMHPGGLAVLINEEVAGQDVTESFYGLHRHEVLECPQYAHLQIGVLRGEESVIHGRVPGALSKVPYAEPTWLSEGFSSPYYIEHVAPGSALNLHAMQMGPGKHLKGLTLMKGLVTPEELIITQEIVCCGARGYGDGAVQSCIWLCHQRGCPTVLLGGKVIGLPPVLNFGSPELKAKIIPEVLSGKKFICLTISEAHASSDVMGMQTTAIKSDDGKEWIVNGTKKWITNRQFTDYFTTGCKTEDGFTVILISRTDGISMKPIKISYSPTAGTVYITFDNVRSQWRTRSVLKAESYKEQLTKLTGQIAFLKMYSVRSAQETAQDTVQIFDGRRITKTGMGRFIEHYHRTVPFDALLGGAEDVLGDLGVRQAMRAMPKSARL